MKQGVWVAYYPDLSAVVLFADELECLRHAVENHMEAKFMDYGKPIKEQM
jgi:hypothetical protein